MPLSPHHYRTPSHFDAIPLNSLHDVTIVYLADDSFYEAMEQDGGVSSPTSGAAGASAPANTMTEEEMEAQREEWRKELTKV